MCSHTPVCPSAEAPDADAAQADSRCFEQGWTLLCNGILLFEDTGQLRPDLAAVAPRRPRRGAAGKAVAA
ncbi:DUF5999 family protein [Streptomyces iconiensis]|uniref:DUF5999 family protein n=1 Tax=Streptomyces iconiensis TaxID=1384038 RepID=A0ABT7A4K7_9ACTN|nr:DUF5999 family protein [Streptomyces iconiensis]MDJ1136283.1 DUF5999 family protein [Streptomyces iconiensis]